MKLFGWWRRGGSHDDGLARWRAACAAALESGRADDVERLREELNTAAVHASDVDVEEEMLDALVQLRNLQQHCASDGPPVLDTQHRVIGTEVCHFAVPVTLSSDAAQPSGRLLMTGTRAIFVGAGRTSATAWHAAHDIARVERDVLLLRSDGSPAAHFRFNTFADAVTAAFLAGYLRNARRARL